MVLGQSAFLSLIHRYRGRAPSHIQRQLHETPV